MAHQLYSYGWHSREGKPAAEILQEQGSALGGAATCSKAYPLALTLVGIGARVVQSLE